jgi:hypothetical protein
MADAISEARRALEMERADLQEKLDQIETALTALGGLVPPSRMGRGGARRGPGRPPGRRRRGAAGRLPRGALAESVLSYLDGRGREATHGEELVQQLDSTGMAPRGANPKASLQNALQRLEKQGKVRNIGRNRWRRLSR